jgi:hypothetical protein
MPVEDDLIVGDNHFDLLAKASWMAIHATVADHER